MLVPLVMFLETKFYNSSMTRDDQTLDAMSPKFEEIPNEVYTYIIKINPLRPPM